MRGVPVKSAEQQGMLLFHKTCDLLVRQRTMLICALRSHLAEFGIAAGQGTGNFVKLVAWLRSEEGAALPELARSALRDCQEFPTHLLKADLVRRIDGIIRQRRLTQAQAGELLGLSQPDVSRLLRGSFRDYSMERLLRLLMALGRDVEIVIRKPRARRPGRMSVEAAE
jgi:predicted XRE-type DNA-binding protein